MVCAAQSIHFLFKTKTTKVDLMSKSPELFRRNWWLYNEIKMLDDWIAAAKKSCITFRVLVIGFFQRRADCTTSWYGPWKNRYLSFSFSFFALKGQDTKMRFSVEPPANSVRSSSTSACSSPSQQQPSSGDSSGFQQWHDAMRMVARLPGGVPPEFRRKVITYFL